VGAAIILFAPHRAALNTIQGAPRVLRLSHRLLPR
jgi:hypothetical protein